MKSNLLKFKLSRARLSDDPDDQEIKTVGDLPQYDVDMLIRVRVMCHKSVDPGEYQDRMAITIGNEFDPMVGIFLLPFREGFGEFVPLDECKPWKVLGIYQGIEFVA